MAGRSHQRKAKRKWSQETIRRRGVRAVVAGLRLKKEHQELASDHAGHIKETRSLEASLKHLASRNDALRKAIKQRNGASGFTQKTGNSWNHNCDFDK
jgi:hypothetical protein